MSARANGKAGEYELGRCAHDSNLHEYTENCVHWRSGQAHVASLGEKAAKPAFRVGQDATGANYEQFAAAPPVEAGLNEKCDKIARGACSNWDAGVPHLVAKAFVAFIRSRDQERDRELVENLEELRKYAEHKAGCDFLRGEREIDCSCGLGAIKESVRAVLAARKQGGSK